MVYNHGFRFKKMKILNKKNTTVFVGLSGGVDSSVSAALLKREGYNVVGVFIRTWQPDFIECSFREDRLDAMRVAAHLDIPFLECDAEDQYKKAVADYMVAEYTVGRTPNPDIMCNREIKFGIFWNFAKAHGADFIATGHYAQTDQKRLLKAHDATKDQAYFLYRLTSDDLAHVLFPIGGMKKDDVRKLAGTFGLPTAQKKDSQGICMLGDLDIKQFLSHYIPQKRGDVLNESGEVIGYHDGAVFLTLGERHGFTITKKTPSDERQYIIAKDVENNTVTVSKNPSSERSGASKEFHLSNISWVSRVPEGEKKYTAQIRYHGDFLPCGIQGERVVFDEPILVALGQSIVFYDGEECLGGGIFR